MAAEPNWVHGEQGERSAQVINIDNGKYIAVVAICAALCGVSCVNSYYASVTAEKAATESRVSQGLQKTLIAENDSMKSRINRLEDRDAKH